jgi:HEAT repeat protein
VSTPDTSLPVTAAERERVERIDRLYASGAASVGQLIAQLEDPSWAVRRAVVSCLAAFGDESLPALLEHLCNKRGDENVLAALVEALVMSTGAVEDKLGPLAAHRDAAVAADVAQVLGRRQRPSAVPALMKLVQHESDNVAVAAIEALGRVGSRTAVEALLLALRSGNFFRVFPAIDVLGRSGDPRVIQPLAALLDSRHYALEAARALGRTGDKGAVAPLARRLETQNTADLRVAAQALARLRDQYAARYGTPLPIQKQLRQSTAPGVAALRLAQAAAGADAEEQSAICVVLGLLGSERAVPALLDLVTAPDPVGAAANRALHELGRDLDGDLSAALTDANAEGRRALLPLVTGPALWPEVVACLEDSDAQVRASACEALSRMGDPRAVPALFERLGDASTQVVQSAVAAIQSLGGPRTERMALEAARTGPPAVRRWAMRILAYFGFPSALDVLLAGMSDSDSRVQESAIQGLAFIDDPRAKDALLNAARHSSAALRAVGLRAIGQTSAPDPRLEAALLRGLSDPTPWARYYACQSIGRLRVTAAVEPLIQALADASGQVRVAAIEALSHFEAPVAQQALAQAAGSPDTDVQQAALIGLGIGRRFIDPVIAQLQAPAAATRLVAVSALADFPEASVPRLLARAAQDRDESVRNAAISALGLRPEAEATAALIELAGPGQATAVLARAALSARTPTRVAGLLSALETADDDRAALLTDALARIEDPDAIPGLITALGSASGVARKAAAVTLSGLGTSEAIGALRRVVASSPDAQLRRICAAALAG